jgi:hypothetical protein
MSPLPRPGDTSEGDRARAARHLDSTVDFLCLDGAATRDRHETAELARSRDRATVGGGFDLRVARHLHEDVDAAAVEAARRSDDELAMLL